MRSTVFFTALLASVAAVSALPIAQQAVRGVDSPISTIFSEKEAELFDAPTAIGLPALHKLPVGDSVVRREESPGGVLIDVEDALTDQGIEILELRKMHKAHRGQSFTSPRITYYSGGQLARPACGGPTPSPNDMIAAVKNGGEFQCGDRIKIQHAGKHVVVRVVDYCAACSDRAVDLSTGAFRRLASLTEGVISGAQMTKM